MAAPAPTDFKTYQDRKQMSDEKSNDGYTKLPNAVVDDHLKEIDNVSELKVTIVVIRKTIGFQKSSDIISTSQFEEITGLAHQSVIDGLKLALDRGIITREKSGQYWSYSVKVVQPVDTFINESSPVSRLEVVQPVDHLSSKVVQPIDTQKKGLNKTLKKDKTTTSVVAAPPADIGFEVVQLFEPQLQEQLPEALLPDKLEASQPGPATDKDRAQPGTGGSSLHIPAPLQPDLAQEVKGFEAGDRGRDMAHGKKARDKPKVKGKEPDSRRNHPNVEFYKLHMHYSAKEDQLELLTSEEFDFTRLLDAFKFWKDSGYYRGNIRGVIDVYHDEGKLYGYRSQRRQNLAGNGITTPRAFNPIPKPIKPRGSRPDGGFTTAEFAEDY